MFWGTEHEAVFNPYKGPRGQGHMRLMDDATFNGSTGRPWGDKDMDRICNTRDFMNAVSKFQSPEPLKSSLQC